MASDTVPKVVVVGAGFAGLQAVRKLAKLPVHVTIIDKKNHHTFQPLLYQVATAGLSPSEIAAPIRWVVRMHKNVEVLMGEVNGFDLERRLVKLPDLEIEYDYLIVAAGARHAYFGHEEWAHTAPGLKTIEDALEIRRRVLLAFELAERQASSLGKQPQLNFVVIGGGPTGVELAGTLAEIARKALANEFRSIDPQQTRVILIEGGPRVLPSYTEDLSKSAEDQLKNLGVEVHTSSMVNDLEPDAVHMGEVRIPAAVILWAAGVAASPLGKMLGAPIDRAGRVVVEPDLSLPGHREVFVVGDLAAIKDATGKPVPGVAPAALQEGEAAVRAIKQDLDHQPRQNFMYHDKGSLATIGRAAAIAQIGKLHISGFVAWLAWLFIHIFFLIGFRNRLFVMFQWAWSYITYERSARLITGDSTLPGWAELQREPTELHAVAETGVHPAAELLHMQESVKR